MSFKAKAVVAHSHMPADGELMSDATPTEGDSMRVSGVVSNPFGTMNLIQFLLGYKKL